MMTTENVKFTYSDGVESLSFEGSETALYRILDRFSPGGYGHYTAEEQVVIDAEPVDAPTPDFAVGALVRVTSVHYYERLHDAVGKIERVIPGGHLVYFNGFDGGHNRDRACWYIDPDHLTKFDGFRKGDRVVAVAPCGGADEFVGKTGTVLENDGTDMLPIRVQFDEAITNRFDAEITTFGWWCEADSLEFTLAPKAETSADPKGDAAEPVEFKKGDIVKVVVDDGSEYGSKTVFGEYGAVSSVLRACICSNFSSRRDWTLTKDKIALVYRPTGNEPKRAPTQFPEFNVGDIVEVQDDTEKRKVGYIRRDDWTNFMPLWVVTDETKDKEGIPYEIHELKLLYRPE